MSDRPTPETDAFSVKFKSVCGSKAWVPTDICRRFERERDEAREEVERQRERVKLWCAIHEKVSEGREDAERERDEAREVNTKFRDIAERAINYLDQSYRDGFSDEVSDLRYELEQIKEETK